jgi:3-hydroxybutyryl-CoA dehydrogenase
MNANNLQNALVLGAGTMGNGIAQSLAMCGITTTLLDLDEDALQRALESIKRNLDKGVERGKVTEETRTSTLASLKTTTDLATGADGADVVVEAVPENMALKQDLLGRLSRILGPDALLVTNTSALSVSEIATAVDHPERLAGMHFFNPAHIMKLVEIVRGEASSEATIQTCVDLTRRMGKEPITVKDSPGFASSRLGLVIGLEAMRMLEAGVASAEDIDKAMTLGYGFPMGPLHLTDLVGLDVRLSIAEHLEQKIGPHFAPPNVLREKVAAGELGKKTGQGFFTW